MMDSRDPIKITSTLGPIRTSYSLAVERNPRSNIVLDNRSCVYCHKGLNGDWDTEHVIGRKFVPKGALAAKWNLIVRACAQCNQEKSRLENDLSVITMWPSPVDQGEPDQRRIDEIERKKRAISNRTKKWVSESEEVCSITTSLMPGCESTFGFIGPPQYEEKRVARLARFHIAAFFYLITYDRSNRTGHPIPGGLLFDGAARQADWGNPRMRGFQDLIADWDWRVHGVTADGYFKVAIRRNTTLDVNTPLWSWACEWNKNVRAYGLFGDRDQVQKVVDQLPLLRMHNAGRHIDPEMERCTLRYREEARLPSNEDSLFHYPHEFAG